jgi:hypothetical protein
MKLNSIAYINFRQRLLEEMNENHWRAGREDEYEKMSLKAKIMTT